MIYIFETKLIENKSLLFALNKIYGLGVSNSQKICKKLGISVNFKVKDLTEKQIFKLTNLIESSNFNVASNLKKKKLLVFKKLTNIKSYRGLRKIEGLPVRGQRTHTNSKTSKKKLYTKVTGSLKEERLLISFGSNPKLLNEIKI